MNLPPPFIPLQCIVNGVPASPGIAIGYAYVLNRKRWRIPRYKLTPEKVAAEMARLEAARDKARRQLSAAKEDLPPELKGQESIFEAFVLLIDDPVFKRDVEQLISGEKWNAETAVSLAVRRIGRVLSRLEDEYLRSRAGDMEAVGDAIINSLLGLEAKGDGNYPENTIVVAYDMTPAEVANLPLNAVKGLVIEKGSRTSHTAIIAHSMELPAVVGAEGVLSEIEDGDLIIMDGNTGHVMVNPDEDAVKFYTNRRITEQSFQAEIISSAHLPSITLDDHHIQVHGNMELMEELPAILLYGGDGIGLYRTEFLYMAARRLPSEEELFGVYRKIVEAAAPKPVTIRTLDAGSDKMLDKLIDQKMLGEHGGPPGNQALGLRGIRFCLKHLPVFRTQLRAIMRASAFGNLQIMLPMISSMEEVRIARKLLEEIKVSLWREGHAFNKNVKLGIMIEVPSAVVLADWLAQEVDFFSIGTNDLIQYTLAVDRVNQEVAEMYQPLHPAILRMVKQVIEAGQRANIQVSICGDMAAGTLTAPILVGLGANNLSMPSSAIPRVKRLLRMSSQAEMSLWADNVLQADTTAQARKLVTQRVRSKFPELFN